MNLLLQYVCRIGKCFNNKNLSLQVILSTTYPPPKKLLNEVYWNEMEQSQIGPRID